MSVVNVTIRAKTPLSFRKGRDISQAQTLDYVPGSALLGAFSEAHRIIGRPPDEFNSFFLSGIARYGNAYPANFSLETLVSQTTPVQPLPFTARSCKRAPGFFLDGDEQSHKHHGVTDALIPFLLFDLSGQKDFEILEQTMYCPLSNGHAQTHRLSGYYRRGSSAQQIGLSDITANKGLRSRTGIDYERRAAAREIFYSRENLLEDSRFTGSVYVDDAVKSAWESFVKNVSAKGLIRVGNNRSRGFGLFEVSLNSPPIELSESLEERIQQFNSVLRTKNKKIDLRETLFVPITLISDAILYDNLLRPRLSLDEDYLATHLKLPDCKVVLQMSETRRLFGWSSVWRMPKTDELAITMGSVFVLAFDEAKQEVLDRLKKLEVEGIGSRRIEGFGRIRIASEFHYEHFQIGGGFR